MEPFIQLTYNDQCPLKTSQLTETSFVNNRKVTEHFWFDLLERKCPEGLGKISESLLKDDSLTPEDFDYKPDASQDTCTSQQVASCNDCLQSSKIVDNDKFKTPLTSKCKDNNISETPCLFSQDESVTHTPTPSLESQLTCHGDTSYKPAEASPRSTQGLPTPMALSIFRSGSDWSKRGRKTPDILAEIMGQKTSTLSCLLAGGNDDDIIEWSDSMATPPLKIKGPAGDEGDGEEEDGGDTNENKTEGEDQPPSKRIARVLFSGSTANHSMDPVELSLDDTKTEPPEDKNTLLNTAQTTDNSCIAEEFSLEYSYQDESRRDVRSLSETLNEDDPLIISPSVKKRSESRAFSPSSPKPNLFQSPGPSTFLSPTAKTPFKALAQSTPKPVFSENRDMVTTPRCTSTSSYSYKTELDGPCVTRHRVRSLTRDTNVHSDSSSLFCDKVQARAACDITRQSTKVDCKLEVSDVTFGSPSRSFELAMALEADKLGSGVEKDSRTSELGSSLSVCLNAKSSEIDQVILNKTFSEPSEDLQRGIETPPSKANLAEEVNEKTNSDSFEPTTGSADDHGNLVRKRSFCKAPGLRRSVRTKRFSYPTGSQVAKQHTAKRTIKNTSTADVSRVFEEDKSTDEEGKVILDHSAMMNTSSPKGGEGVMPMSKRLKSDEMTTICESNRDVSVMSSAVSHIQKDDVLFDMDALSQFPVECICSPPSLNSLNVNITTSTVQQQVLFSESIEDLRRRSDTIPHEIDASIVCKAEDIKTHSDVVHSDEKTLRDRSHQGKSDVIECPVSCANFQKNLTAFRSEWKTELHTAGGENIEMSDKGLNCAYAFLEELDLPTVTLTSHEERPTAVEEVDVDIFREGVDLITGAKTEKAQPEMAQEKRDGISAAFQATLCPVIKRYSPEIEGNVSEVNEHGAAHKSFTKSDNKCDFDKQHSSVMAGFCGFSTASRKQVRISESAMKKARKTLSEIDSELDAGDSSQAVKDTRKKETTYSISSKQRASGNKLREAHSEGLPSGISQLKDMSQPDELNVDASGINTSATKEEIEEMALQTSEQSVNELKCKQSERVNDSLLEDLLNDCKRQRRDSLATICEEKEGMEEHHGQIVTNTEEVSDSTLRRSDRERSPEYQETITTEYCSSTAPNPENPRVLFKTASGNPVSVSKAALSRAKTAWNKIDRELALEEAYQPQHKNVDSLDSFHAIPAGNVDVSPRSLSIAKDSRGQTGEKMIEGSNDVRNNDVLNTLEGKVNKPDHDVVSEDQHKSWTHFASSCGFKIASGETGKLSETGFATCSGFQTAGGRKVILSEEAWRRGRDVMIRLTGDPSESLQENVDCHSDNRKNQSVSKDAEQSLRTGEQVMQSKDKPGTNTTSFSGFHTVAGKRVTLSNEMLEKGAAIMQQIDKSLEQNKGSSISHSPSTSGFSGFQTAGGQSVRLSRESLAKGAAIMQQIDRSLEQSKGTSISHSPSSSGFSGFQTAGGQSVRLSKESLEKGAAIMQQIDRFLEQNKGTTITRSPSTSGFSGFQTARGQSVKLSRESLEKGAAIMQQIDRSLEQSKGTSISYSPSTSGFSGFQTAGGQSVRLSRESLEKGAAIMQQIDRSLQESNAEHTRSTTGFSGFQTASGQSVKLSKESMKKGAAIMQQIDISLEDKWDSSISATSFSGFQTASRQSVKLSKESMKKGAAIMQQIDRSLQEEKHNKGFPETKPSSASFSGFSGFQTAGGKKVEISESALAKAKETIADIDRELQVTNTETAAISLEASRKAREQLSIVERETGNNGGTFGGFFTAGGQRVSVSEQSLTKAKAFLQEADSAFNVSKTKDADAFAREHVVATELPRRTMSTSSRSCFVEHDEAVSREVLESSEALLAYESVMDVSDTSGTLRNGIAAGWSSFDTSGSFIAGREKGSVRATDHDFPRRCSTPLRCSEDMFNSSHRETRDGMKPCTTTPSGVLHDRRTRFHAPLRARLTTVESSYLPRRSDVNRSLQPLRAMTPGCFKSKAASKPRTSTPVNSSANRRISGPRPQFITPYRKQEATRDVSPLARCSSSRIPVRGSAEVQGSDAVEPSSKKQRISASNSTMDIKNGYHGLVCKTDGKVKPQRGYLSQLRHDSERIKLKDYVGHDTLPGQFTTAELIEMGVSPEVISVSSSNAGSFRFIGRKYFSESVLTSGCGVRTDDGGVLYAGIDGCVGLEEIQSAFLCTPGVDGQLVNEQWISNHYRWLVWKLAAMEVAFPRQFAGRCLTPDWVLSQLKYRYDREIDSCNRSALKKILERDDTSSRTMVLCVSSVTVTENQVEDTTAKQTDNDGDGRGTVNKMESCAVIEVTDGWYGIRAMLDRALTGLLHDKKIVVGQKLFVYGAELIGSEQAVSPLEAPASLMLRLHANSTRRARWDVKLGFHSHAHAFPLPLSSLFGDGGFTGCVDVIVLRQYPVQWMEKMSDGTNVFRNSRLEEREAKKFEADRQKRREKLFLKIQEEFEKGCQLPEKRRSARFRRRSVSSRDLKDMHDGKEIFDTLTQASDPDCVKECLDERQVRALEDYQRSLQERKCAELQSKFERVWKEQEEEQRQLQRNVVPLLKVQIADYLCKGQARQNAMLSIWRPSEEVMHLLSEGTRLRIYHLTAAGVRNRQGASELQLSATRTTRYEELPSDPDVKRVVYMPRQACSFDELRYGSFQSFSEVDVVGVVVFCSPLSTGPSSSMQTVYLSDEDSNLVAIKFWGGLKAAAVEDLIKPCSFICCSNLTVRPDDRVQCPSLTYTDLSTVTLKPRQSHLRTALRNLHQSIPDVNLFTCHIQQTLTTILRPNRASPSVDVKNNTVRAYGRQSYNSAPGKQCADVTDAAESTCRENGNPSVGGQEYRPAGSTSREDHVLSHKLNASSIRENPNPVTPTASARATSRQSKRKLLDSIAEPPPLSPLPSSIPASVRREFKRPRQVETPGNVRLEPRNSVDKLESTGRTRYQLKHDR